MNRTNLLCAFIALLLMWTPEALGKVRQFHTDYFGLDINEKCYIVGMYNTTRSTKANFSPADRPSPLVKLYDKKFKRYYYPVKAQYISGKKMYTLDFSNGSTAQVRFEPKKQYYKLTMESLTLRDVTYANFFPSSFGVNFPITKNTTVEDFEHIEATAVGYGTTYFLKIGQNDVESCPQKYEIFRVIRTWEEARRANAFPQKVLRLLQNPQLNWRLVRNHDQSWTLHRLENGVSCETFHLTPRPSMPL